MFGGLKSNADDVARLAADTLKDTPSIVRTNAPNRYLPFREDFGDLAQYVDNIDEFPPISSLDAPPTNDEIISDLMNSYYAYDFDDYMEYNPESGLLDLYNAGYKFDNTPDYDAMVIDPADFGQRKRLIDSIDYPDGFTNPDDYARYYDSLELGFVPKEFYIDPFGKEYYARDLNTMSLAGNLLHQQELNMPMSPRTFDQAHMLVDKYLEPGYYATKDRSMPHQKYVRNAKLEGTLYDLYEDILNYKKPW